MKHENGMFHSMKARCLVVKLATLVQAGQVVSMLTSMQNAARWSRAIIGGFADLKQDREQSNIGLAGRRAIQGIAQIGAFRFEVIAVLFHAQRLDHYTSADTSKQNRQHRGKSPKARRRNTPHISGASASSHQ